MADTTGVRVLGFGVGMSDERFRSPLELDHTVRQWGWEPYRAYEVAVAEARERVVEAARARRDACGKGADLRLLTSRALDVALAALETLEGRPT